jgi:hypothetical protein
MAIYHLSATCGTKGSDGKGKSEGKGSNASAGKKSRYLLRQGPYAKETQVVQDGATLRTEEIDKTVELVHTESGNMPRWAAGDPIKFWDASDQYERVNGTTFREVEVGLPEDLSEKEQIALARAFAEKISQVDGGSTPWTLAVHQQDEDHPERRHVHIILSDRIMDGNDRAPETFFKRWNAKKPEKGGARKTNDRSNTKVGAKWTDDLRPLWQAMANEALQNAGLDARIDHRTLRAQRRDLEIQAITAAFLGDENKAARLQRQADDLDRPPMPKRGRVLSHNPEAAPDRAARMEHYKQEVAARRIKNAKRRAQEAVIIRSRLADQATAKEQRDGFQHPDRPSWQLYRQQILAESYNQEIAELLGRWVKVERVANGLRMHNRKIDITDHGDKIIAGNGNQSEIETMLELAKAKGWTQLVLTGSRDFQERAGAEALAAGFDLADGDLKARILDAQRKEAEAKQARILEASPILAEWMREHPRQAQAQRLAGGRLPFACPVGLDAAELQQTDLWAAADAWTMARYGDKTKFHELSNSPDPIQAKAAAAGWEERLNDSARSVITLRVGKDAPNPNNGLRMSRTDPLTRENIEGWASDIKARQASAGAALPVIVTFSSKTNRDDRVKVLEHLLRQDVALDTAALKESGHERNLQDARRRLKTHEPDGSQQAWYTQHLEEQRQKKQEEERAEAERRRIEAELARQDEERQKRIRAAEQRQRYIEEFQKRVRLVAYEHAADPEYKTNRMNDPEYRRIVKEIKADPELKEIAREAYDYGLGLGLSDLRDKEKREQHQKQQQREQQQRKGQNRGPDFDLGL